MNTKFPIQNLSIVFTVDKGKLKVLLLKRKEDPYKGYWVMPTKFLEKEETFFENTQKIIFDFFKIEHIFMESWKAFSFPMEQQRYLQTTVICYMDEATREYMTKETENYELEWFDVQSLPKMAFNHEEILLDALSYVRIELNHISVLKVLYPSDFTIPELQTLYEQINETTMDRRNFRKKILSLDILEDTLETTMVSTGRPAKLYKFKEEISIDKIF